MFVCGWDPNKVFTEERSAYGRLKMQCSNPLFHVICLSHLPQHQETTTVFLYKETKPTLNNNGVTSTKLLILKSNSCADWWIIRVGKSGFSSSLPILLWNIVFLNSKNHLDVENSPEEKTRCQTNLIQVMSVRMHLCSEGCLVGLSYSSALGR